MSGLVIYNSKYGATREYAEELAKRLKWEAIPNNKVSNNMLNEAEKIVIAGNIRMGKMKIASWVKGKAALIKSKCKAVIAVGGTEPSKQEYYLEMVEKNLSSLKLKKEQIFGCGGRQIKSNMKGFDAFVFKMLDKMVKDPKEKDDILKDKDHVDMKLLDPVVEYLTK